MIAKKLPEESQKAWTVKGATSIRRLAGEVPMGTDHLANNIFLIDREEYK